MTQAQRRQVVVGAVTTVIGATVLALLTGVKDNIVMRGEYDLHVQASTFAHQNAARADSQQIELTLELLCELRPENRRCR